MIHGVERKSESLWELRMMKLKFVGFFLLSFMQRVTELATISPHSCGVQIEIKWQIKDIFSSPYHR
jgi:hypothetical protein